MLTRAADQEQIAVWHTADDRKSRQSNAERPERQNMGHLLDGLCEGTIPVLASSVLALHISNSHSVPIADNFQRSDLTHKFQSRTTGQAQLAHGKGRISMSESSLLSDCLLGEACKGCRSNHKVHEQNAGARPDLSPDTAETAALTWRSSRYSERGSTSPSCAQQKSRGRTCKMGQCCKMYGNDPRECTVAPKQLK